MSKVVVTGASGYIGGRVIRPLLDAGWEVHAVIREPASRLPVPQTVCDLAGPEAGAALAEACSGAEVVIHLAGENEVLAVAQPAAALAATVVATEKVGEAAAEAGVRRLIYMSTVHVYGARIAPGTTLEEDMRAEPRSAYAISRLASEHVAAALAGSFELLVFRLTNSVGAPDAPTVDRWTLVANDLCRQGAVDGELRLKSSGTQWRDFVPLSEVCRALVRAAGSRSADLPSGVYNLGSGRPTTVRQLAELIQDEFAARTGRRPALRAPDPEPDPPPPYFVSVERAAGHGLRLDAPLQDAIAETVAFCLDQREELP